MKTLKSTQAALIIEEHFRLLRHARGDEDILVSAREAGRRMVEIYRLLTGEMPQARGIEAEFLGDELPGIEFASPLERNPSDIFYVYPGPPDVLIPGDHHDDGDCNHRNGPDLPRRANKRLPEPPGD